MTYKVFIKPKAVKFLETIPKADKEKINIRIKELSNNPRDEDVKKLTGVTPDRYRARQGDYRIFFSIEDSVLSVEIIEILHRKNSYKK